MITLYKFGPFLGTPDSSPFVIKTMMLFRFAGLAYREAAGNPLKGPHRFLPYIEDDGVKVADSTFIRFHIEKKYKVDFDAGLSSEQRAVAWTVEKMCEEHLYFAMLDLRWMDKANFKSGLGAHMFGPIPAPLRPLVKAVMRRMNAKRLHGHGLGRHKRAAIAQLAIRDIDALAALLGDKPYLMGDNPCSADAAMFGMLTSILTPSLESPIIAATRKHANLVAYRDRITDRHFPEMAKSRAAQSETAASFGRVLGKANPAS